jgi:uncharacterized membrane protein (DUF2068 family)
MPVTVAVVLSVLVIVLNFISPLLPQGTGDQQVPASVIVVGIVLGVLGVPAALGLWLLRRWGYIATLVVTAINLLLALPGIFAGPAAWIKALSAVFVLVCAAIIVLVTRPEARGAYR